MNWSNFVHTWEWLYAPAGRPCACCGKIIFGGRSCRQSGGTPKWHRQGPPRPTGFTDTLWAKLSAQEQEAYAAWWSAEPRGVGDLVASTDPTEEDRWVRAFRSWLAKGTT